MTQTPLNNLFTEHNKDEETLLNEVGKYINKLKEEANNKPELIAAYDRGVAAGQAEIEELRAKIKELEEQKPVAWEPIPDPDFSEFKKWQELPSDDKYIYHRAPDCSWLRLKKPDGCYLAAGAKHDHQTTPD